jgi:hypothetical protein
MEDHHVGLGQSDKARRVIPAGHHVIYALPRTVLSKIYGVEGFDQIFSMGSRD